MDAPTQPFLAWVGSKRHMLPYLSTLPAYEATDTDTYIEPFLGSGSVLLHRIHTHPQTKRYLVNDVNQQLIWTFEAVRDTCEDVCTALSTLFYQYNSSPTCAEGSAHARKQKRQAWMSALLSSGRNQWDLETYAEGAYDQELVYYTRRMQYNKCHRVTTPDEKTVLAALFIFINKCGYASAFRVNQHGDTNVPYRSPHEQHYVRVAHLLEAVRAVSAALNSATVEFYSLPYEEFLDMALKSATTPAFLFVDPPYHRPKLFSYSGKTFSNFDQKRLLDLLKCAFIEHKARFIWTNSATGEMTYFARITFKNTRVQIVRRDSKSSGLVPDNVEEGAELVMYSESS